MNPSRRPKTGASINVNAIAEIGSSNLLFVQNGSASLGDAASPGGFAAQFAAAVQGLFGPAPALSGVPPESGNGHVGNTTANAATGANPSAPPGPTQRKAGTVTSASVAGNPVVTALAWQTAPQWAVPSPNIASTSGSSSIEGSGTEKSGSVTTAASTGSIPVMSPAEDAQATGRGSSSAEVLYASAGKDIGASATTTASSISQNRFADVSSVARPQAVPPPQVLDEARVASAESDGVANYASSTQTGREIESQDLAPGTQTSQVNPTNLMENVPSPTPRPPERVPATNPVGFSASPLIAQTEPTSAAAQFSVTDSSQTVANQQTSEKTSALAALTAAGISLPVSENPPPTGNAGQSAAQQSSAGSAVTTASTPVAVTALSAGAAVIAALASVQSAVPTAAITAKVSMRGTPARISGYDSPASGGGSQGAVLSSPSSPAVAANSSRSSPAGSETPFSVFFPATNAAESVAAAFPKMMVPAATNASLHNNTQMTAGPAGTAPPNPQVNGSSQQSSGSQPGKNSSPANSEQNAAAASSAAHPANSTAATAAADSAQASPAAAAAAPVAAQPITGGQVPGTVMAQAGNTAAPADSPQKQVALPPAASNAANAASPPQALPQSLSGPVQVAQMASRAGQAEMKIGMNTSAFGSVEVRAVIHASDVGLTIGSEKGDLCGLLTNEMPSISNSLEQQNLRLSNVSFMQGFASGGDMTGGGNAQQQQRSFSTAPSYASLNMEANSGPANEPAELLPWRALSFGVGSLSVLA